MADERQRLQTEEQLAELETKAERYVEALNQSIEKVRQALQENNPGAADGWITRVRDVDRTLLRIDAQALAWERRILKLLRRQMRHLKETP